MGNRYFTSRPDLIKLSPKDRKRIMNSEQYAKRKAGLCSARAVTECAKYKALICPSSTIFGEYGQRPWFKRNEAHAIRELQKQTTELTTGSYRNRG